MYCKNVVQYFEIYQICFTIPGSSFCWSGLSFHQPLHRVCEETSTFYRNRWQILRSTWIHSEVRKIESNQMKVHIGVNFTYIFWAAFWYESVFVNCWWTTGFPRYSRGYVSLLQKYDPRIPKPLCRLILGQNCILPLLFADFPRFLVSE